MATSEERLERLERQVRSSRRRLLVFGAMGVVAIGVAAEQGPFVEVPCAALLVKSEKGQTVTALRQNGDVEVGGRLTVRGVESNLPIGTIISYAGGRIPDGWLACDGSAIDLAEQPELAPLAKVLGTAFDPDGKTVLLPDLRSRFPIGSGKLDKQDPRTERALGRTGGSETHTLTIEEIPAHIHGVEDPGHDHRVITEKDQGNFHPRGGANGHIPGDRRTSNEKTGITIKATGGNKPHNIMNPFLGVTYLIKYR